VAKAPSPVSGESHRTRNKNIETNKVQNKNITGRTIAFYTAVITCLNQANITISTLTNTTTIGEHSRLSQNDGGVQADEQRRAQRTESSEERRISGSIAGRTSSSSA
jgi:hypothetical protein